MTECWCKSVSDYECSKCSEKNRYIAMTTKQRFLSDAMEELLKDNVEYEELEDDYCDLFNRMEKQGLIQRQ